ncbi:MAG: uroporphyrinogen decarboxylase family protein [Limisphaerales bacterium]
MEVLNCLPVDRLPVWLLPQFGRCLPNCRAFKTQYSFRQLVRKPELTTEGNAQY